MNSLHTSLTQLLKKLEDKEVLKKGKENTDKFKAEELAKYIRDLFVENYPELKVRRLRNQYITQILLKIKFYNKLLF